ncbi:alpha/beta fold hydrolase [Candidatus Harpocratesius sp.]
MNYQDETTGIFYQIIGDGIPILFLHGLGVDHRTLFFIFESFFQNHPKFSFQRIFLDLPGMGKTPPNSKIRSSDDILKLLLKFIKNTIGDSRFILIGQSYGGYLAQGIMYHIPMSIIAAILICPVVIPEVDKRNVPHRQIIKKNPKFLVSLSEEERQDYLKNTVIISPENWKLFSKYIRSAFSTVDKSFISEFFHHHYPFLKSMQDLKQSYQFPTLFLLGKQDSTVGYKDHWQFLSQFSHASFFIIDAAGHNLLIEQTTLIFNILEWYFNQIENNSN